MSRWAGYFATRFPRDARRAAVWQSICEYLQPFVPPTGTVLELGAGYCDFINGVRARRRLALDIHDEVLRAAATGVEAHVGSCTRLDFLDADSVDVVFASNLLEHLELPDVMATVREVWRVLKPEGRLLLLQPNFRFAYREYFDDYTHRTVFTDRSLPDLLTASGFGIMRVEPRFLPFSLRGGLPACGWLVTAYLRSPWRPWAGQMLAVARKQAES